VPLEEQDGGVVREVVLLVVEDGVHETAQDFEGGLTGGGGPEDEVDEALFSEEFTVRRAGLDDPVGVAEDAVSGVELHGVDAPGHVAVLRSQPERQLGRAVEGAGNHLVPAQQDGPGRPQLAQSSCPVVRCRCRNTPVVKRSGNASWTAASMVAMMSESSFPLRRELRQAASVTEEVSPAYRS